MNRYVAVPASAMQSGQIPSAAAKIARTYSLELRAVDNCKEISIVSDPVVKKVDYDRLYADNRIWSLDLTNEFVDMSGNCYINVDDKIYQPKIQEKHCLKFRIRFHGAADKKVLLFVNDIKVEEMLVTVEK